MNERGGAARLPAPIAAALALGLAVGVALLIIGPRERPGACWNFAAAPWALALGLVGALAAIVACVRAPQGPSRSSPWARKTHVVVDLASFGLGSALCFALADNARSGDFERVIFDIRNGVTIIKAEPLSPWLLGVIADIGGGWFGASVLDSLRAGLALFGGLGFVALRHLGWAIAREDPQRGLLAWAALASSGASAMWFAHIETYTFAAICMVLALAAAVRAARGEGGAVAAIGGYTLACAFHLQMLCLGPALAWGVWRAHTASRARTGAQVDTRTLAYAMVGALLATAALQVLSLQNPTPYAQHFGGGDGRMFVAPDQLASRAHLVGFANELGLMALGSLVVLVVLAPSTRWRAPDLVVLALAAAGWLTFMFFWNPDLGAWRDWDLFAAVGWWVTALVAGVCLAEAADPRAAWLLLMVIGLNLARTMPFVVENHRAFGGG